MDSQDALSWPPSDANENFPHGNRMIAFPFHPCCRLSGRFLWHRSDDKHDDDANVRNACLTFSYHFRLSNWRRTKVSISIHKRKFANCCLLMLSYSKNKKGKHSEPSGFMETRGVLLWLCSFYIFSMYCCYLGERRRKNIILFIEEGAARANLWKRDSS